MSTVPVVLEVEVPETPVAEVVAPVVPVVQAVPDPLAPVQKRYEYQPVDEHNRPLGGKQVILYTTELELVEKLRDQNMELVRKMRTLSRENRLGRGTKDEIAPEIEKIQPLVNFAEKPLSAEERFAISQELNDPEKFESARDRLLESAVGVKPSVLRDTLNTTQLQTHQLMARQNAEEWLAQHPEFYKCQENIATVCDWMVKNGLKPTVKNFEYAQVEMEKAGLLFPSPIVREVTPVPEVPAPGVEVPKSQEPAPEPARISEVPVSQSSVSVPTEKRPSPVPSGFNNRIASSMGSDTLPTGVIEKLTMAEIDRMPSDVYRKNLQNPAFAKHVNELAEKMPPKPTSRR
jgi:hypothetical protein